MLEELIERLRTPTMLDRPALAGVTVLIIALIMFAPTWRRLRYVVTTVHEIGHVVMGWIVGRRIESIRLHHDTSGLTITRGPQSGPGVFLLYLAGYPAAPLSGCILLLMLFAGHAGWALALLVVALILALLFIRNAFGLLLVIAELAVTIGVGIWANPLAVSGLVLALGTVLSVGGLRAATDLWRLHRRRKAPSSDAAVLGQLTRVGPLPWAALFVVISLALTLLCAWLAIRYSAGQ